MGISKLRTKHKTYEARRLLCDSYDVFLADDRILPLLPKLLGKEFFKKKRLPVPVNLKKADLTKELTDAIEATYMTMATGPCFSIKIGTTHQSSTEIAQNIMTALPVIVSHIPKKWENVQSVHLKTATSLALPLYNALP